MTFSSMARTGRGRWEEKHGPGRSTISTTRCARSSGSRREWLPLWRWLASGCPRIQNGPSHSRGRHSSQRSRCPRLQKDPSQWPRLPRLQNGPSQRPQSGSSRDVEACLVFSTVNRFRVVLVYGRGERCTTRLGTLQPEPVETEDWEQQVTEDGQPVWYNRRTQRTSWSPSDIQLIVRGRGAKVS